MKGSDVESMTKLLKEHDVPLSAVRANKLLLSMGFLEEAENRPRRIITRTALPSWQRFW